MLPIPFESTGQLPLLHIVESDDYHLESRGDVAWFNILRRIVWKVLLPVAVGYYEALYEFNLAQAAARLERREGRLEANPETLDEATLRLFRSRATVNPEVDPIHGPLPGGESEEQKDRPGRVDPETIAPGKVPLRLGGKKPKCFFAMAKAFCGISLMGRSAEPEFVHQELVSNPSFARTCGFTLPDKTFGYRHTDIPSLRKLEQFDQIMTEAGLWGNLSLDQVMRNLEEGKFVKDEILIHDTFHEEAYSGLRTVEVPPEKEGAKQKRKSQSKTTKSCRCREFEGCPHPWVLADDGAGTVVKAGGKRHWAHKASVLGFAGQMLPLHAVAMTDAASHDSKSVLPHLRLVKTLHPGLLEDVKILLDDSALDDKKVKARVKEEFGIELRTEPNARNRKPIEDGLPKGIEKIAATGVPVCRAGFPFDYLGRRTEDERFLFRAPTDEEGEPVCTGCDKKEECLRGDGKRRHISIPFETLPMIDPELPHLSRSFQRVMANRTLIERIIKVMKCDYGDPRLTKRGTKSFQATLDKTIWAIHLVVSLG